MADKLTRVSDAELIERCAQRHEGSLGELYDRHAGLCLHRAVDVLRNQALAEEAVQDAFLDLWKTAESFDPDRAAVRTWLCVLVHRRAVDIARREAKHHLADGVVSSPPSASYTAEELLLLQIDRRRVRAALDRLSPTQRQVIELAYWVGLTQSQIAIRCDVPVGTIKSRTFDALARLAKLLTIPEPTSG
jgi:RNA polymerase sigma-70 factor, ECF subfamily